MMQPSTSVSSFIGSLPRIRRRRFWNVVVNGKVVCGIKASRKADAMAAAEARYPGMAVSLQYMGFQY